MKRCLAFILVLFMLIIPYAFADGSELIKNGDFSQVDGAGLPEDWTRGMWYTDAGISYLYVDNSEGDNCAAVINADENDARWEQTISVEPDTIYKFSARVRAEDCGDGLYGATISFSGTFSYSESVVNTNGEWKDVTVYGQTGEDQDEVTVMLRVGGYGNLNTGSAWFDDVSCVEVDEIPENVTLLSLEEPENTGSDSSESEDDEDEEEPARNTECYLLLTALYAVLILALSRRSYRLTHGDAKLNGKKILIWGLVAAAVLRLILAVRVRGYNTDINCFKAWSERIFSVGIGNFYAEDYFCDYPPGYMLILWIPAALRSMLGINVQSSLYLILLKSVPIACDLLGAALIYHCAVKNSWNERLAAAVALVYAFNPAIFIDSAAWGQIDSVFTLFVVLCAIKASDGDYIPSMVSFAIAMLIKPQAMLFAPLGLFAVIVYLIREKDAKRVRSFVVGVLAAVGVIYATGFIFTVSNSNGWVDALLRPIAWLIQLYSGTMGSYAYLTINALNLYTLLDMNWARISACPGWTVFAWIMFALAYLYSMLLCLRSKEKHHIVLAGGVLITLIFTFAPMIHERYIFPAILLLALAYVYDRDKRILISLTVMSCTLAMNEILVLQGGMGSGNYGHLQSSEQWLNAILSLINVLNALLLMWTAADICGIITGESHVVSLKGITGEMIILDKPTDHKLDLRKGELIFMAAATALYSVVAFTNLGVTKAPQTSWVSSQSGESIVFDLGDVKEYRMIYYGGICNSTFTVELSDDGETWTEPYYALYNQGQIFRWIYYVPRDEDQDVVYGLNDLPDEGSPAVTFASSDEEYPFQTSRYVRITAQSAGLTLSEFGFWTRDSQLLKVSALSRTGELEEFATDPNALIDEQDTVVETPSYLNSTYFDEIYHARTAYELLHGMSAYEWTHPQLGKILMMAGIAIFGMTPFGWRFMGTFVGVLMLPLMYLLVKQLTKSKHLSAIAMLLMMFDAMHFTQTRLATIDSYSVFWIMLEYLFMFRYVQMDWHSCSLRKTFIPLGLCGVTMGIACATKWIGIYAAAGLAILFFWKIISEYVHNADMRSTYLKRIVKTCAFCVFFFVIIPVLIYYFSYYPQLRYEGVSSFADMFSTRWVKRVAELQKSMFDYHSGLGDDTHYFRSPWYQWPIIWWPMWYYSGTEYMPDGVISSISCMGNPAVWWFGLFALLFILIASAWRRRTPKAWLIVLLGFASQYLPWVLVPRSTFIYHYFASVPFIIICSVLVLDELRKRDRKLFRVSSCALLALALILFIAFYPLESGMPVARSYANCLRWFEWYNF